MTIIQDDIFKTHKLNEKGLEEVKKFKTILYKAVEECSYRVPTFARCQQTFLKKMEEAVFYGTKAIAERPDNHEEIIIYKPEGETK